MIAERGAPSSDLYKCAIASGRTTKPTGVRERSVQTFFILARNSS